MRLKTKAKPFTREQRVIQMVSQAPKSYQKIMKDAYDGTAGKRRMINSMCLYCTNYVRDEIRHCTCWSCPLWMYRPYQSQEKDK